MRKRKFWVPDGSFDIGALEGWLEHLAAKGWTLKEQRTYRALFVSAQPAKCRVRLEPVADRTQQRQEELDALYAEMGWERKGALRDYIVYYCVDDSAPELHTDPAAANWARQALVKRAKRSMISAWAFFLVCAALGAYRVLTAEKPLEALICNGGVSMVIAGVAIPAALLETIRSLRRIRHLQREMEAQLPLHHGDDWRKAQRSTVMALVLYVLFWGTLVGEPFWRIAYAEGAGIMETKPYVEAVALNPALDTAQRETELFARDTSLLAPQQYYRLFQYQIQSLLPLI